MRKEPVIAIAKRCLNRIHALTVRRHGRVLGSIVPDMVNTRVFLAAYMVVFRSGNVFEIMDSLASDLCNSAIPVVTQFESIVQEIVTVGCFGNVRYEITLGFPSIMHEYLSKFKLWKVPDEARLTVRI